MSTCASIIRRNQTQSDAIRLDSIVGPSSQSDTSRRDSIDVPSSQSDAIRRDSIDARRWEGARAVVNTCASRQPSENRDAGFLFNLSAKRYGIPPVRNDVQPTYLIREPRRPIEKFFFCLTGPYLTRRATIGRLELPLGRGRFVGPSLRAAPTSITAYTVRGSSV